MRHFILPSTLIYCAFLCLCSCEKPIISESDNNEDSNEGMVRIRLNANNIENSNYDTNELSRATDSNLSDVCNRITLAIFNTDNEKIKTSNQIATDKNFGRFDVSLPKGDYNIVFVAHNAEGNPTITSAEEIKFPSNKVTDTFYYYGNVSFDDDTNYNITLSRAVAKLRLVIKDDTPKEVKQMKFYYTGGSSTFNATTGYGCVNSKQTEYRKVQSEAYTGESSYEVYTFPHDGEKALKFTISALNGTANSASEIYTQTIDGVIMKRNTITQYTGYFYGEEPSGGRGFDIRITDEWQQEDFEY